MRAYAAHLCTTVNSLICYMSEDALLADAQSPICAPHCAVDTFAASDLPFHCPQSVQAAMVWS